MATAPIGSKKVYYRVRDGKPMAETSVHQNVMIDLITGFRDWLAADPLAYVAGNLFLYFVEGDPKRVVSPDVMVVRGVDKHRDRDCYKTWEDGGKGPDLVVEVSSKKTYREDLGRKFALYRDELKVREYFLFDALGDYLKPPFQGFHLFEGQYVPIEVVDGRLPSEVLGLHLEADGRELRLFEPIARRRLPTRLEAVQAETAARLQVQESARRKDRVIDQKDAALQEKDAIIQEKDAALQEKDAALQEKDAIIRQAEAETERLRRMIEALKAVEKPGEPE